MCPPEVIEWTRIKGFCYFKASTDQLFTDLDINDLINILGSDRIDGIEKMKRKRLYVIGAENDEVIKSWTLFSTLYAEIIEDERTYILNDSQWYCVEKNYSYEVHREFDTNWRETVEVALPSIDVDEDEGAYNDRVARENQNLLKFDRDNINYGGGRSSIEVCDLYDKSNNEFIHVKKADGSSVLSHLFMQGTNSGELISADQRFRALLEQKMKSKDSSLVVPDSESSTISFALTPKKNKETVDYVPFFSKITANTAFKRLKAYKYKVRFIKIRRSTNTH